MIRILVADDHAIVRRGVRQIIDSEDDMEVIGEAADYPEIRRRLRDVSCDVLVLDLQLPGKNGIEVTKALREEYPRLAILILSSYPEDQYAVRALKAGARGYVSKLTAPERIVEAVRTVATGRKYISAETAEALAETLGCDRSVTPHRELSDREFQVLKMIARGRKLSDIADKLALSPKTVSVYRGRILEKMGVSSNAELTHYAIRHELVEIG